MEGRFDAKAALNEGFGLLRARQGLMLTWALLFLVMTLIGAGLQQWRDQMAVAAMAAGRTAMALNLQTQAVAALEALISILISSVVWSSGFAALLHPETRKPIGFGVTESRVLAVRLITQFLATLPLLPLPVLAVATRNLGLLAYTGPLSLVFGLVGALWASVATLWVCERGRIAPIRCWSGFRGVFGGFIPLFLAIAVVFLLLGGQVNRVAALVNGGRPILARPGLDAFLSAPILVQTLLTVVIVVLQVALLAGITAHAWRVAQAKTAA